MASGSTVSWFVSRVYSQVSLRGYAKLSTETFSTSNNFKFQILGFGDFDFYVGSSTIISPLMYEVRRMDS